MPLTEQCVVGIQITADPTVVVHGCQINVVKTRSFQTTASGGGDNHVGTSTGQGRENRSVAAGLIQGNLPRDIDGDGGEFVGKGHLVHLVLAQI